MQNLYGLDKCCRSYDTEAQGKKNKNKKKVIYSRQVIYSRHIYNLFLSTTLSEQVCHLELELLNWRRWRSPILLFLFHIWCCFYVCSYFPYLWTFRLVWLLSREHLVEARVVSGKFVFFVLQLMEKPLRKIWYHLIGEIFVKISQCISF